jgi:hypothetical protein
MFLSCHNAFSESLISLLLDRVEMDNFEVLATTFDDILHVCACDMLHDNPNFHFDDLIL